MNKIKIKQDRKTDNIIIHSDGVKTVFSIEMFRRIQNGGGSAFNNKSVQDINKNQWRIIEHNFYGKVVLTFKDRTLKLNMEHICNQFGA